MFRKFFPRKEAGIFKRIVYGALSVVIGLIILGIILLTGAVGIFSIGLPNVTDLENITAAQSTEIYDSIGNLLYTIHGDENREYVKYEGISPYLINATVAIEDSTFWENNGFSIGAIAKGVLYELFGIGTPRGGSTITQQYVKNAFLSPEHSYIRKIKELILAIRVERAYDKKKILELYLNRIPYGNNAFGAEKAAEVYFGKSAKDLDLAQSSILASLPQGPTRYNPYGNNKYSHLLKDFSEAELAYRKIKGETDLSTEEYARGLIGQYVTLGANTIYIQGRSDLVLRRMYELGNITMEERQAAVNELKTMQFNTYREAIKYPHFVLYVKQLLENKYGKDVVEEGGLKVYTTIDPKIQNYAEEMAKKQGEINAAQFNTNNVSILTVNPKTGQILAMVGSRDYFNEEIDGNVNVVLRPRQPGSSFKPIVYSEAFYKNYNPATVLYDIPTKVGSDTPQDFDGKWLGQISMRKALGNSRNVPAIQTYFLAGQQDPIIDLAIKMGITSLDKAHSYGYPLALGAGEVSLMEMVTAYSTFANNGKKPELTPILKVVNANGDVLEQWKQKEFEEVLDPQIAYLITDILADQKNSVGSRLYVNGKINAAKTGTSTKETKDKAGGHKVRPSDGWTLGYTTDVVTGVWTGNTDGSGLAFNADGYNTAAPIFNAVMTKALSDKPSTPFPQPKGIKTIEISKASGKLPGTNTPPSMITTELFPSFSVPTEVENVFFKVKIDKVSGLLATEFTPVDAVEEVTFQNYEPVMDLFNWKNEIKNYYKNNKDAANTEDTSIKIGLPPTTFDEIHTAQTAALLPTISITSPVSQSILPRGNFEVVVDLEAPQGVAKVEYYLDDKQVYFTNLAPYSGQLNISKFLENGSLHLVVAKVIDTLGYSAQSAIQIKVGAEKK